MSEVELASETYEPDALAGAGPAALQLALASAGRSSALAPEAAAFLLKQGRLVDLQTEHLHEQRELQTSRLRLGRWKDRMYLALQVMTAGVGLAAVAALAVMAWQASQDHSLVIESFSTPADMTARGASGQVLAEDLVHRTAAIRAVANANSLAVTGDVRADQAEPLKLEIPETGVSMGEVSQFLHRWLGHQTRVSGAVREDPDGQLAASLVIAGAPPIEVKGPPSDLDGLMQKTAERAFAAFDPANYVIYLDAEGRQPEALAVAADLVGRWREGGAPRTQIADAYALWADEDPDRRRALAHALIATDQDPRAMVGWMEAAKASRDLGHEQAAVDFARRMVLTRKADQLPSQRQSYAAMTALARATIDRAVGDFAAFAVDRAHARLSIAQRYEAAAEAAAGLHDLATARAQLGEASAAGLEGAELMQARWRMDSNAGHWAAAVIDAKALVEKAEAAKAVAPGPMWAGQIELKEQTLFRPQLAYAEAMGGDPASAQTLIAAAPQDCYRCTWTRGRIAAAMGDRAGSEHWFAEAVAQAPRLPTAYLEWGKARLAEGDAAGAAGKFAKAHKAAPRFADPLERWGEALLAEGHASAALAKFSQANRIAPLWGRNHLMWGEALARLGRRSDARTQLRAAVALDLSPAEAPFVARWLQAL